MVGSLYDAICDVIDFHAAFGVPIADGVSIPEKERVELRKKLIAEEVKETLDAIDAGDLIEIADGLADIIVVVIGTALEYGIPLAAVWDEVHRSNMAKLDPETGKPIHREDGKVLKPASWTPPDIKSILRG
jgi:predicted HAD superfamily Cof-like phosphohydrolase